MSEEGARKRSERSTPETMSRTFSASVYRAWRTKEEVADFYSNSVGNYDQDSRVERYKGPVIAANAMAKYFGNNIPQTKVLDVAAGTGLVGEQLQNRGFKHLDALDPAAGMLEQARKKNIYTNIYCEFLDGNRLPIDDDTYDCCVISGGMGEGHIPCRGLNELIRLTRPGGLVCILMNESRHPQCRDYRDGLEQLIKELEDAGKWKWLSRDRVPKYAFGDDGVRFTFRIC
ncbi:methyltransferase-like protein 27 [Haliotis asinina]|uniref:methyltransferase-like protein 27 n=1 Tax=Haliotis asinina TaxID=109174 RepID=UPI003531D3D4